MIETFLEMLMKIPGSIFLWYFAGLSIVCIVIGWLWKNVDGSIRYLFPELTRFDTIAALREGMNATIRTAIFSLWNKKLVNLRNDGNDTEIFALNSKGINTKTHIISTISCPPNP